MTFFPIQKYRRHVTCQHALQTSHYAVCNSPGIVFVMSETIINLSFTFQWCSSPMIKKPASKADAGGFSWSRAPFSSSLDFVDSCSALLNCFRIVQQCEMMAPTFLPSFRKWGCPHNPWIHPGFTCFLCFFGPRVPLMKQHPYQTLPRAQLLRGSVLTKKSTSPYSMMSTSIKF